MQNYNPKRGTASLFCAVEEVKGAEWVKWEKSVSEFVRLYLERGKLMLKKLYEEVQGIVYKCRNEYYLHLWELSDWDQEGMICLHELISREEGLVEDIPRLRKYFKTKFRNRILDYIRKQESQKRRYDKEPYEEVGEISHRVSEGGLWLDDYYLFHETLRDYRNKQSKEQQEELDRVLRNERFRGRQRVLKDLRIVFKEFDIRSH